MFKKIIHAAEEAAKTFNGESLAFEITPKQKKYLEAHICLVDKLCKETVNKMPHTVIFEEFEDEYLCKSYFNLEKIAQTEEEVAELENLISHECKVCIVCPQHERFWQTPSIHLKGLGCPKCE